MGRLTGTVIAAGLLALATAVTPLAAQAAPPKLYLPGTDLRRANLDGSGIEPVVPAAGAVAVAVDRTGGKVYFAAGNAVRRANLDGSGVEDVVPAGVMPTALALDPENGKIYFTDIIDPADQRITRANLNGTAREDLLNGLQSPTGIALDVVGGKLYFAEEGALQIRRANLDGSGPESLVTSPQSGGLFIAATGIDLDLVRRQMYFSDAGGRVWRAGLDGATPQVIAPGANVRSVAVDPAGGKVYWQDAGTIRRANLDGTGTEDVLPGVGNFSTLALDLGPRLLTLFPASGKLPATAGFEFGLILGPAGLGIANGLVTLDGLDVTAGLAACGITGTVTGGGLTFRCPGLSGRLLGGGPHTLGVVLRFSDDSSTLATVRYEIVPSTEP